MEDLKHFYKISLYHTLSTTLLLDKVGNPVGLVKSIGDKFQRIFDNDDGVLIIIF